MDRREFLRAVAAAVAAVAVPVEPEYVYEWASEDHLVEERWFFDWVEVRVSESHMVGPSRGAV